jgi:threonine aldolase
MGVNSHTWRNECGNVASIAGVMPYPLDDSSGCPDPESIRRAFQPAGNVHYAHTTLLTLENTHNGAGGVPVEPVTFTAAVEEARSLGLKIHVDGARIFDATAYFEVDVKEYSSKADSIQFCLSKGLGAPMGSVVCGSSEFIARARKFRKALGGGQRQSGIAAAAGLVALRDMRGRLREDHVNAAALASRLEEIGLAVESARRRTNMVYFSLCGDSFEVRELIWRCAKRGLLIGSAGGGRIRMVTHLGLDASSVRRASLIIKEVLSK